MIFSSVRGKPCQHKPLPGQLEFRFMLEGPFQDFFMRQEEFEDAERTEAERKAEATIGRFSRPRRVRDDGG